LRDLLCRSEVGESGDERLKLDEFELRFGHYLVVDLARSDDASFPLAAGVIPGPC
jgi:hypothetical protein